MAEYISPEGHKKIVDEYNWLLRKERPRITAEVSYAASLGDRSENSEYLYGKQRLREIDGRLKFLERRLDVLSVVDSSRFSGDVVLFGATVELEDEDEAKQVWTFLGVDEVDTEKGVLSYVCPLGKAVMGKKIEETFTFETPKGQREMTVLAVSYPKPTPAAAE